MESESPEESDLDSSEGWNRGLEQCKLPSYRSVLLRRFYWQDKKSYPQIKLLVHMCPSRRRPDFFSVICRQKAVQNVFNVFFNWRQKKKKAFWGIFCVENAENKVSLLFLQTDKRGILFLILHLSFTASLFSTTVWTYVSRRVNCYIEINKNNYKYFGKYPRALTFWKHPTVVLLSNLFK